MASRLLLLAISLAFLAQIHSHPVDFLRRISGTTNSERNWLWGWTWGWGESTVSIVDRWPSIAYTSRPAAFGPELFEPLLGYVIPLSSFTRPCGGNGLDASVPPNLGCPKLCLSGPNEPERKETWIALVQRGECQFVDKVREAQRLGASAVVVGGNDPEISGYPDSLVNMYSPSATLHIFKPHGLSDILSRRRIRCHHCVDFHQIFRLHGPFTPDSRI